VVSALEVMLQASSYIVIHILNTCLTTLKLCVLNMKCM